MTGPPSPTGTQAMDAALPVLRVIAASAGGLTLNDLAGHTGLSPSKLHRYLASFARAGLVVQKPGTRHYDLGPFAAELGLAAVARNSFVNRASDSLAALTAQTGLTAMIAVWGNQGATIVRWHRAPGFAATSFGLGSTLPLLGSATGRVFLAHLPDGLTEPRLRHETADTAEWPDLTPTPEGLAALVARIRADGFAGVDGRFIPGLRALAVPILNWQGEAEAAVTLIGTEIGLLAPDGAACAALLRFSRDHSLATPGSRNSTDGTA
ncbi:MAG: IclR family transcriptional regulator [Rhodobacteraceae bacterium]|nr:IclR family transcriptional regulator [Paracoccaceae bacterium]